MPDKNFRTDDLYTVVSGKEMVNGAIVNSGMVENILKAGASDNGTRGKMNIYARLYLTIDGKDFLIVGITLVIVFVVSLLNERGIMVREKLKQMPIVLRWVILYLLIFYIITFGAYGAGYIPVDPMYANF